MRAKATGLEIGKLPQMTEKFDTFEGAATQAGKLNAALGGNFVNAMDLLTETDPAARFDMIRDAITDAGLSFDDMSYYQRKYYAEAAGLDNVNDLAMMLYLLGAKVKSVSTTGQKDANGNLLEIGSITVQLDDIIANIYVNRQAPLKIRKTMIGGDEAMILWNELDQLEPVKIYNHDIGSKEGNCSYQCRHRAGAVFSPMVQEGETLLKEVEYFFQCLENKCQPVNNAQFGLQVVRLLEATEESLARNAALVEVKECKLNSFPII